MNTNHQIEIKLSKRKLFLLFLGSLVFVALGWGLIIDPTAFRKPTVINMVTIRTVGVASVLLFGLCVIVAVIKLFQTKPGLIIGEAGITDRSSAIPAGFIPWSDITDIYQIEVAKQKLLLIDVKNPSMYISRQTNRLKRKSVEMNYTRYGTPVCISAHALQYSFDELKTLLTKKLTEYSG